jgi:hypothetical protein
MSVMTLEGIVEKGRIRLLDGAILPEKAKVYVVVPQASPEARRSLSPRLGDPRQIDELSVEEMESEALEEQTAARGGSLIGLFADEPELIDEVCRMALEDRASRALRVCGRGSRSVSTMSSLPSVARVFRPVLPGGLPSDQVVIVQGFELAAPSGVVEVVGRRGLADLGCQGALGSLQDPDRRLVGVVALLILDVGDDVRQSLAIEGEGAVLLLPPEVGIRQLRLVDLVGRITLHFTDEVGDRQGRRQRRDSMDVILDAVDGEDRRS